MGKHTKAYLLYNDPGQLMLPLGYEYCNDTFNDRAGKVIAMCTKIRHAPSAGHKDEIKRWMWG